MERPKDAMRRSESKYEPMMKTLGWWIALLLASYGCGAYDDSTPEPDHEDESTLVNVIAPPTRAEKFTKIPARIEQATAMDGALSLTAAATAHEIQLTDCLSGYTATVTQVNADGLEVYQYDRDCLAKLTEFTYGGRVYLPTAADPFTTWQDGDTAVFDEAGEPGTLPLKVIVLSTLSNPVSGADVINYGFSELTGGATRNILWTTVGSSSKIMVGATTEPSFTIQSIEFLGITGTGAGQYRFVMECTSDIGITNVCETVDLVDLDYKLIEDTYASAPTEADAVTIFGTAGTAITLPGERVAPGDQGTTNGGFVTVVLDGPDDLANHPNMIFMMRSYNTSYQYFNVDVTVSAQY